MISHFYAFANMLGYAWIPIALAVVIILVIIFTFSKIKEIFCCHSSEKEARNFNSVLSDKYPSFVVENKTGNKTIALV